MAMPIVDGAVRNLGKVKDHITQGMDDVLGLVANLAECEAEGEGSFDAENVAAMEKVLLQYADMERTLRQFTAAAASVASQMKETESCTMNCKELLDASYQEIASSNTDQELQDHAKIMEFHERLQELQEGEEEEEEGAGPSSIADQSLGEEELVMTQTEVGTRCPFTQQEMTIPIKNTLCGHHYEKKAMEELLKKRKKIRCPLPGCVSVIHADHLELDLDFKKLLERQKKANRRRQADSMNQ